MKKFIKFIALALVLSTIALLAACGSDSKNEPTTAKAGQSTEQLSSDVTNTNASETQKTTKAVASITNLNGYSTIGKLIARTTNKKGNASAAFVKALKGYSLKVMQAWEPAKTGKLFESSQWCLNQVKKEFGVNITYSGFFTLYNEKLTANLAARAAEAQIYMVQDFNFASYFKNGYLCDLSTAMIPSGVDFKDPWYNTNAREFLNINYKQYGWISYGAEYTFPYGIMYNKNLVKKAKLTDIETLVNSGKWTWSTLEKYAKKLNSSNVVGFGCGYKPLMLASMSATKGGTLVNVKKGQSPTSNINAQVNKDCLSTMVKWCGSTGFCKTFDNQDWTYPKVQFAKGKIAMLYCSHDAIKNTISNKTFSDSIGFVPFPTETGTKKYTNVCIPQFTWFIPSQHKSEAAKALFLQNEIYRQQYRFAQRDFQINWNQYFNNGKSLDSKATLDMECNMMYSRGMFNNVYDWRDVCETGKVQTSTIINEAIKTGGVQSAISKFKDSLDKCYSDVWNGYKVTGNI